MDAMIEYLSMLAAPVLTAQREPERAVTRSDYIPVVIRSKSRKYCTAPFKCGRKTYWVVFYPDLGEWAKERRCWKHLTDTERAILRAS